VSALTLIATLTCAAGVDTTNLWVDVPKDLSTVALVDLTRTPVKFQAVAKKVTVVSFYSSILADDRDAKALDAVAKALGPRADLAVLFVDVDLPQTDAEFGNLKTLASQLKLSLPVLVDDQLQLLKWVNGKITAPDEKRESNVMHSQTFVLLKDGAIVECSDPGGKKWAKGELEAARKAAILKALNSK
jgi:peroxiredoxin